MIYSYGVTKQGHYHIKTNAVCQDSHYIKQIGERFAIAAVADGLGSEKYSDIASKIAAENSVQYCAEKISVSSPSDEILEIIKKSFSDSLSKIEAIADAQNNDITEYDTTLTLAVYLNGTLYYGHSGDSGIVVLNQNGVYQEITEQQRDENGCVYPLCFGEKFWCFGIHSDVASVFLATDGMLETLFPYLLQGEDVNIYVVLAEYMMNNDILQFGKIETAAIQKKMENFIDGISGEQVSDDKTVLVMLDTSVKTNRQPISYYQTPDWATLKKKRDEEYKRKAYPHLFSDN